MGLESATFISELDDTFPLGGDPINKGDDHLRLLKTVLQSQFPNLTAGAVTPTQAELNLLDGELLTTTQLNALQSFVGTVNRALISDGSGNIIVSPVITVTELNRLDGCTVDLSFLNGTSLASSDNVIDNYPAGTLMCFQQTAAPTGYTKAVTHNNKALRVVTGAAGSAGTSNFTTVFGLQATNTHTLTVAQMPTHTHTVRVRSSGQGGPTSVERQSQTAQQNSAVDPLTTGSSNSHSHNMELRVQYVDLILASKD